MISSFSSICYLSILNFRCRVESKSQFLITTENSDIVLDFLCLHGIFEDLHNNQTVSLKESEVFDEASDPSLLECFGEILKYTQASKMPINFLLHQFSDTPTLKITVSHETSTWTLSPIKLINSKPAGCDPVSFDYFPMDACHSKDDHITYIDHSTGHTHINWVQMANIGDSVLPMNSELAVNDDNATLDEVVILQACLYDLDLTVPPKDVIYRMSKNIPKSEMYYNLALAI